MDKLRTTSKDGREVDHLRRGSDVSAITSAFAGSISGLVARTFTAPLDVVKIRLQLQEDGNKYKGIVRTMSVIAKEEGLTALWKGNIPASAMYVIYGAVQFSSYSMLNTLFTDLQKEYHFEIDTFTHSFILGSLAGCTSTFISYPCDLLRTRFVNNQSEFSKISVTVKNIFEKEGPRALFKGLSTAIASVSLYTGLVFWSYEAARIVSSKIQIYPSIVEPTCGFAAGVFAKSIVFPLDLIRKRLQINTANNSSIIKIGLNAVKKDGLRGLYKGFFVSLVKSAPTTALSIWTYQTVLRSCISEPEVVE